MLANTMSIRFILRVSNGRWYIRKVNVRFCSHPKAGEKIKKKWAHEKQTRNIVFSFPTKMQKINVTVPSVNLEHSSTNKSLCWRDVVPMSRPNSRFLSFFGFFTQILFHHSKMLEMFFVEVIKIYTEASSAITGV